MKHTKQSSRILFMLYVMVLIWIILFRISFSVNDFTKLLQHPSRSINLVPFGASVKINNQLDFQEIIYNLLIFVPFGGLLGIVSKRTSRLAKVLIIFGASITIEALQFIFGLGATDITDVINNTLGGVIGLLVYAGLKKAFSNEMKLDKVLTNIGLLLFSAALLFIIFILIIN